MHVFRSEDFFLEQKVDDVGRIDVVDDCRVQTLELELQHRIRATAYKHGCLPLNSTDFSLQDRNYLNEYSINLRVFYRFKAKVLCRKIEEFKFVDIRGEAK